jgi:hypothetical protein
MCFLLCLADCRNRPLDFGRLALQGIKENRYLYTDAEIKTASQTLDIVK